MYHSRMMNIVIAGEKDEEEPLHNAGMVAEKYGLSTEFLTATAWRCQQKYGVMIVFSPLGPSPTTRLLIVCSTFRFVI